MRAFARPSLLALGLIFGCGAGTILSGAPARAQFFFPFFDNRPTTKPDAGLQRRRSDGGAPDLHAKPKARKDKSHAADKNPKAAAPGQPTSAGGAANPAPPVDGPPPPYEPQLLRLSEIMGALTYLQSLCGGAGSSDAPWRDQMENLMSAEDAGPSRREKLAGAYNRGLQGYEYAYHACTDNARLVRARFLDEGARIAHDISKRYRAN